MGGYTDYGGIQMPARHRTLKCCFAEAEHAPVRTDQPVPLCVRARHSHDRRVEGDPGRRPAELVAAEVEHPTIGCSQSVTRGQLELLEKSGGVQAVVVRVERESG